jgi:hypothetical protein
LSVRFTAANSPTDAAGYPFVQLVDGTQIPIADFRVAGTRASITPLPAAAAATNPQQISLPVRQIAVVRFKPLTGATAAQWDEVRAQNLPSDVLVIFKRGGESLDYVEGVVGDVSADKIDFKLDGETTRADRTLAAGLFYFRRDTNAPADPPCVLRGKSGLKAAIAEASIAGDTIRLKTTSGVEFTWPLDDLTLADFSAGKIAYLSDLEPASQKWTPLVALPAAAAAYGKLRRDQSPFGGPLVLALPVDSSPSPRTRDRVFEKGLALRSRAELTYRLPSGYRRLTALAGIDPHAAASGNVKLSIQGDGRDLFVKDVAGIEPPATVDVDIANVRRLTIFVDYGRNLDQGDWLILGDARIVK